GDVPRRARADRDDPRAPPRRAGHREDEPLHARGLVAPHLSAGGRRSATPVGIRPRRPRSDAADLERAAAARRERRAVAASPRRLPLRVPAAPSRRIAGPPPPRNEARRRAALARRPPFARVAHRASGAG